LTPAELSEFVEAFNARERREWQRTAWLASTIVSVLAGKSISPKRLLPEAFEVPHRKMTKEQVTNELKDLKRRLKIDG